MGEEKDQSKTPATPEVPKIDAGFVAKQYAVGYGSRWLANLVMAVPIIIFWVICYFLLIKTGWTMRISSNVRGVLIIAILAVPLIVAAFAGSKLRDYFTQRFSK